MLSVKNDIIGIIKEVKRIMVNCQIKDLMDIKLKAYVLRYNIVKLVCKLNKEEGLNSKKEKF